MLNILIISVPFICWNSGFFWTILFLSVAICRYRFNRNKILLYVSVIGTLSLTVLPIYIKLPIEVVWLFQIFVLSWSLIYYIIKRLWKRDIVFLIMEPFLLFLLGSYIIRRGFDLSFKVQIYTWLTVYITFQVLLVIIKILAAYKLAYKAENKRQRLKLLISYLPHIESSVGLSDFAVSGASLYFISPTPQSKMVDEIEHLRKIVYAEMKQDISEVKKVTDERNKSIKENKFFSKFVRFFK